MSAEQVGQIERYVSAGGRLLVSGHTSLYNEDGFGGEDFQLAKVLGVDYAGGLTGGPTQIEMRDGPKLPYPGKTVLVRLRDGVDSLGDLRNAKGRTVGPAVVVNRFGKGTSYFLAPRLAVLNFQHEMTSKDKWTFTPNQPAAGLLLDLVYRALGDGPVLKAVQVPEKVLLAVYRQDRDGTPQWLVHVLNATGVRMEPGQTVPSKKSLPAFPALEQDLVFDLRLEARCTGQVVSPDYAGSRPVTVAAAEGGYQRITVAKGDVVAYGLIRLTPRD